MLKQGCHNKPDPLPTLTVRDGIKDGKVVTKEVPDVMSPPCKYDLRVTDPACDGCRHRHKGE